MKYAIIALLGSSQAMRMNSMNQLQAQPWDCSNTYVPNNKKTCWGDQAYQVCGSMRQAAYDGVMKAGGSTKEAWEVLEALKAGDCNKFDMSKTGCEFSMYPNNKQTCWADTGYQTCGGGQKGQDAYDGLMYMGGSNSVSAVLHNALVNTKCAILEDAIPEDMKNPPNKPPKEPPTPTKPGAQISDNGYVNDKGEYCDQYGCYPAPGATTATGGYTDPYCAANGYCNNTMTYYNEKGDYCDIANCYTDSGVIPNINDACDEFGCYNYTQGDIPVTASEDIRATAYNESNNTNSTTGGATTITITTTPTGPPTITTTGPLPATTTGGSTNKDMPSWDELIDNLDTDKSGTFTWKEIEQNALKMKEEYGYEFTKDDWEMLNHIFQMSDTDHNGSVTKEEYEAFLSAGNGMAQLGKLMKLASKKF